MESTAKWSKCVLEQVSKQSGPHPINQDEINKLMDKFGDNPQLIQAMMAKQRFVMPEDANFWKLYDHRHEAGNGERIDMAGYLKELGYE